MPAGTTDGLVSLHILDLPSVKSKPGLRAYLLTMDVIAHTENRWNETFTLKPFAKRWMQYKLSVVCTGANFMLSYFTQTRLGKSGRMNKDTTEFVEIYVCRT